MDVHSAEDHDYFAQNIMPCTPQQPAGDILAGVDLHIAFSSEKLLNLEMLVMEIARQAADLEPLMRHPQSISADSVDKAFEFDVLYGIVDSEVNELEKLLASIQLDIASAQTKFPKEQVGDRLRAATESLNQMQDLIAAIRRESATFEKTIQPSQDEQDFTGTTESVAYENCHMSPHATMQAEDQRNVLQMLDQSIANELDLEKKLCDSRSVLEDLKTKLHHSEQESYFLQESIEALYERMFTAENASQLFLGTSMELVGKVNAIQFYLRASARREADLRSKLEESFLKLNASKSNPEVMPAAAENNISQAAMQTLMLSSTEFLTLRNKIQQLEEWSLVSRGDTEEEHNTTPSESEMSTFGNMISDLKAAISNAESRAQNTEARCTQLSQTNIKLSAELNSLKSQGSDRAGLLETKLKESDTQLEHARASVDAIVEQQNMLRSSMSDMEQMIEDLKEKYLKAETRAENAESKCLLLTDTNLELSEELSFLRGRVESLENSLHQANQLKMSTAKDIGSKTRTITDLVAKLALERERLHLQIVTLTKKNRILAEKCKENVNKATSLGKNGTATGGELGPRKVLEEALDYPPTKSKSRTTSNTTGGKVEADEITLVEDESGAGSTIETVRSIEPTLLNWKHIFVAVLVLLAAVLMYKLYLHYDEGVQQLLKQFVG